MVMRMGPAEAETVWSSEVLVSVVIAAIWDGICVGDYIRRFR